MNIYSWLTAVFEKHGNAFVAYIEEMAGINPLGATIEVARVNLQEALELIIGDTILFHCIKIGKFVNPVIHNRK